MLSPPLPSACNSQTLLPLAVFQPQEVPPAGGLNEDSSVEEVIDFLTAYQASSLASPFSRSDFVNGFVELIDPKIRWGLEVGELLAAHRRLVSAFGGAI